MRAALYEGTARYEVRLLKSSVVAAHGLQSAVGGVK
jgi:hypothetical protein